MVNAVTPAQPANGAIAKPKPPTALDLVRKALVEGKATLRAILPKHIDPDRVTKIALAVYMNKPELQQCTPHSMVRATLQCAELGLDPSPLLGEAHFIPFKNKVKVRDGNQWKDQEQLEVQLMPGYAGLIKLAKQTGDIVDIYAVVVDECEKDPVFDKTGQLVSGFYVEQGTVRKIRHIQKFEGRTGKVFACYGVVQFKDGSSHFEVFSLAELEAIRARSKAYQGNQTSTPWATDFPAMCRKTMIKQALKTVPKSPEKPGLAQAIAADNAAELGEAFGTELTESLDAEALEAEPAQLVQGQSRTADLLGKLGGVAHDPDGVVVEGKSGAR